MSPISSHRNRFRSGLRTMLLAEGLTEIMGSFGMRHLRLTGAKPLTARERANWLQDAACTVLERIGLVVVADGNPPLDGLLVSNHLSYLDVLAYASLAPSVFVAKREVRGWPIFGAFATMAGTIYVDRERQGANGGAATRMEEALSAGLPVVLFPEGTSSDGRSLLRFHSRFFEPAVRGNAVVTAAAIGYASSTAEEAALAYHGDDIFGTHLVRTIGQRGLEARVMYAEAGRRYTDRKEAARTTHEEVESLRNLLAGGRPARKEPVDLFHLTKAG